MGCFLGEFLNVSEGEEMTFRGKKVCSAMVLVFWMLATAITDYKLHYNLFIVRSPPSCLLVAAWRWISHWESYL